MTANGIGRRELKKELERRGHAITQNGAHGFMQRHDAKTAKFDHEKNCPDDADLPSDTFEWDLSTYKGKCTDEEKEQGTLTESFPGTFEADSEGAFLNVLFFRAGGYNSVQEWLSDADVEVKTNKTKLMLQIAEKFQLTKDEFIVFAVAYLSISGDPAVAFDTSILGGM